MRRGARGSAAVRARHSRLAEHGVKRRADGLDGENRDAILEPSGNAVRLNLPRIEHPTGREGGYRKRSTQFQRDKKIGKKRPY